MTTRLIVFGRAPVLGRVKTRLAASVGAARALDAHRRLLAAALALGESGVAERIEFRHDGGPAPEGEAARLAASLRARGWAVRDQGAGDLGERMRTALEYALGRGERPVLIGCDCPVLDAGDLRDAFAALADADAVFAPAEDGGYALVGLARPMPSLFDAMPWGTDGVMAETRVRLAAAGARARLLRTVWDVDVEADLRRWEQGG